MAFALGLAGSFHCAQMCGPIVLAYSLRSDGPAWRAHAAYNAGRILTYSLLGAAAGAAGNSAVLAGAGKWAAMATGVLMILMGLAMMSSVRVFQTLGATAGGAGELIRVNRSTESGWLTRVAAPLLLSPTAGSKFRLGMAMGLLPCGLIWAGLLQAAATGDAIAGAGAMAAFGAGTAGALLGVGAFAAPIRMALQSWAGRHSSRVAAGAVMAAGVWIVYRAATFAATVPGACHAHG